MSPICQEEPAGCGVACVAFICKISYQKAKKLFEKQSAWGYNCEEIVKALKKAGLKYTYNYCGRNNKFQTIAIPKSNSAQ